MNGAVLRASLGAVARTLSIVSLGTGAFFFLILLSFPSFIGEGGIAAEFFREPPRYIEAFLGGSASFVEPSGWLVVGMTHPVILALQTSGALMIAAGSVAAELERGSLELVLTRPVRRSSFLAAKMTASLVAVTVVHLGGLAGVLVARATIPEVGAIDVADGLLAFLGSMVLFWAFAAVGTLVSAVSSLRGRAVGAGVGIIVASFFLNFLANLFEGLRWLGYASPFHYFRAGDLVEGRGLADLWVLVGLGVAAAFLAFRRFARRDLTS